MPEGPEIYLMCKEFRKQFLNKTLKSIKFLSGKYIKDDKQPKNYAAFEKALKSKIKVVGCKGKFMYLILENNWTVFITFGLTGHIVYEKDNHSHIEFDFNDKKAYISDQLKFGTITFYEGCEQLNKKLNELGPDPLSDESSSAEALWLKKITSKTNQKKAIGEVLLNQKINAGVGNYIRAEVLYILKWNPFRPVSSLNLKDLNELWITLVKYMKQSVDNHYKKRNDFKVYENKDAQRDELCKGRFIWWDPKVQTKK